MTYGLIIVRFYIQIILLYDIINNIKIIVEIECSAWALYSLPYVYNFIYLFINFAHKIRRNNQIILLNHIIKFKTTDEWQKKVKIL